jgi:hypothetical protein
MRLIFGSLLQDVMSFAGDADQVASLVLSGLPQLKFRMMPGMPVPHDYADRARPRGCEARFIYRPRKCYMLQLMLNDNDAGKPEGIHLMIGRRPKASFGNSTGDQQMLEYTGAGDGARLSMLVLHDDAAREYAYGPAQGLPDTKVGTFTAALYAEAKKLDGDQHEKRLEEDFLVRVTHRWTLR